MIDEPGISPVIDFRNVRVLNGRQSEGFEELVCQIAGLEGRPAGSEFIRKGKGRDAGLECFVKLVDGNEHGWQVKYSWSFDSNLIRSLDVSINAALTKHPQLSVLTVCLPFDLSDARGKATTPRQSYETWRSDHVKKAKENGRTLEIRLWDAHALSERLSLDDPRFSGRLLYWFGTQHLTFDWFADQFDRTRSNLGRRYTAETNVALPVRHALVGLARNPELLQELTEHRRKLWEVQSELKLAGVMSESQSKVIETAICSFDAIEDLCADQWPIKSWQSTTQASLDVVRTLFYDEVEAQGKARQNHEKLEQPNYTAFRKALDEFVTLAEKLAGQTWQVAATNSTLVTGEAGAGKSHLLADACAFQLEMKRPALLFLGSSLADAEIWTQLIQQSGLPSDYTRDTFLGALDAAGEAAGCRSLLMIDAINERHGPQIWPDRLGGFLFDIERFPHVAIVLSCRSTYISQTIPQKLGQQSLYELEHSGFCTSDARAFLAMRGFNLAEHPFSNAELQNPLLLKTCCDALEREGLKRFPTGLRGVTAVFSMFKKAVCDAIEQRANLSRRRRIPEAIINSFAQEIELTRETYIPLDRAFELVDEKYSSNGTQENDLLHLLETEGMISIEPVAAELGSSSDLEDHVRFTFERFADHIVARSILDATLTGETLPSQLSPDCPLVRACIGSSLPLGVREALAVQLPERTCEELPDVLAGIKGVVPWGLVTPETVRLRAPSSVTERTLELLKDNSGSEAVWDALIRLSVDPDGPFDAYWLHELLKKVPLPERDADWSIYIANYGDDSSNSDNSSAVDLIAWARDAQVADADPKVAQRAAITLTWFLATPNRRSRDTATMGLVNLINAFPEIAHELFDLFDAVNDPYVGERLSGAIYGAALQGTWSIEILTRLAEQVVMRFFVRGPFPLDLAWRDHLCSILQLAESRGCRNFNAGDVNTQPPFESPWPLEPVSDRQIATYTRTVGDGVKLSDQIVSSTSKHGDFASYIINYAMRGWSPAAKDEGHLPTYADLYSQWLDEFDAYATPEMRRLLEAMNTVRARGPEWAYASGENANEHSALEESFLKLLGMERFERYRTTARNWRPSVGSQTNPANFDILWAQRWVCKRAHDLGWDETLHGDFDRARGSGRTDHKYERIGKKYQWIALQELLAKVSDNCAATDGDWTKQYRESVRRLRNIDPSRLMEGSRDWGWAPFHEPTFWMPLVPKKGAVDLDAAIDWLNIDHELLDGPNFIDLASDREDQHWLPLGGFQHFHLGGTTQGTEHISRKSWLRLDCLVVRLDDEEEALKQLKGELFLGSHDLGLNSEGQDDWYLGEYCWRNETKQSWSNWWGSRQNRSAGIEASATTCNFLQEADSYDHSLEQNFSVTLPAPWLIRSLGLRLSNGRSASFVNSVGKTVAFDPSTEIDGPSTVLVSREAFLNICRKRGLLPIWVLGGAKEFYCENLRVYGRNNFTSIYTMGVDGAVCRSNKRSSEGNFDEKHE